jgi:polar amino acid transport system substrate-binding protein
MRTGRLLFGSIFIGSLLLSSLTHAAPLRFVIAQFPPYTSEDKGIYSGIGIDLVKQVMADINIEYQVSATPNYARALEQLTNGSADGLFLASENAQRNAVAVFSEPLLMNNWSWFLAPDHSMPFTSLAFKVTGKIATIHGSNTSKWLTDNNYKIITKANSGRLFPRLLLEKKRIDAVFLASIVFRKELQAAGYSSDDYVEIVEKSKPFGIYISKRYIEKYPDFMKKLNAAIIKLQQLN